MTKLDDLFDPAALAAAVEAGYVRVQTHPTLPYVIHNYSELAQFDRHWTPVTTQCRGLITHADTSEVLARPFTKVHNHTEPEAPVFGLDEPVSVADKVDGSLAIGYPVDGGYAIATRGSFASEQAAHATQVWNARYADTVTMPPGITPLWEIVYPGNRIVVDYGDLDDLVLLAGIHIDSGEFVMPRQLGKAMGWHGPIVESFPYERFSEVLTSEPRASKEGFVVRSLVTGASAKFKYERYVELHRIVTGMNERVVWEHLGAGKPLAELVEPLPDEFHGWVCGVADRLLERRDGIALAAQAAHELVVESLPQDWVRRDYALAAGTHPLRPWLFNILDGRDPRPGIWKTLRPSGAVTMTSQTEESA